jgi:hypothetical protein
VARSRGHSHGDRKNDVGRILCVAHDGPERDNCADQAERACDVITDHLGHHRHQDGEQDQRDAQRWRSLLGGVCQSVDQHHQSTEQHRHD